MKALFITILVVLSAQVWSSPLVIENATVWVSPSEKYENASVVINDGKLVGINSPAPKNAKRINASGKVITAGFINSASRTGTTEVGAVDNTNESVHSKTRDIFSSFVSADGVDRNSVWFPILRKTGVTSFITAPSHGLISGQGGWVRSSAQSPIMVRSAVMRARLGNGALGKNYGSRAMAALKLRTTFKDATFYLRNQSAFNKGQTRQLAASPADLQALKPVLDGRVPLIITAHRQSDIETAIAIGDEFGIRIAIEGGNEAWKVAELLAQKKVPVILDPGQNLPRSFERRLVRDDNAAFLAAKGVTVIISNLGDYPFNGPLRQLAGIAVANGLPWEKALEAITTAPANFFGKKTMGTLSKGAPANLVVWSGDPFEMSTQVLHVVIDGRIESLISRHDLLFERYRNIEKLPYK